MKIDYAAEIARLAAGMGQIDALALETALREQYAGRRLVIRDRPVVTQSQIDDMLRQRMSVLQIARETGISRTSIYRLLGDRKVPKRA